MRAGCCDVPPSSPLPHPLAHGAEGAGDAPAPVRTRDEVARLRERVDALTRESQQTTRVLELLVAQVLQVGDTMGELTRRLVELNTLPGLAPRMPPPLVPAFEQPPPPAPTVYPPGRVMREWEKMQLAKILQNGRLCRSQANGVGAILDPQLATEQATPSGETVRVFDVFEQDDYRLWKLWHYLVKGATLEDVLTEPERSGVWRSLQRQPAVPRIRKRRSREEREAALEAAAAGASTEMTRPQRLLQMSARAERAMLKSYTPPPQPPRPASAP